MQFKKILLTGVNGQVGHALVQAFAHHNVTVTSLDRSQLDLTDVQAIRSVVQNAARFDH